MYILYQQTSRERLIKQMISDKERKERRKGIGGSDVAIILGLSSYKTPYQLFLEKTGIITPSDVDSPVQEWGKRLEPVVRNKFAENHNIEVHAPKTDKKHSPPCKLIKYGLTTFVHPIVNFLRGNVDGYIPEWNCVLETKCSIQFMAKEWGESGSDVIPMAYLVQVAHYCSCLNAKGAYIAVLIGGNDYREFYYQRDMELENQIIAAASDFWHAVQNNIAPAPISFDDLKILYPQGLTEKQVNCNQEAREAWEILAETKIKQKELSTLENDYKFQLMEYMKDAECLTDEDGKPMATWKANKKGARTFLLKGL